MDGTLPVALGRAAGTGTHGDASFDALVAGHRARIVRAVALVVGDVGVAEELTQDAFAKAYASWGRVGGYDAPDAWVRRVAIRDAVRRGGRDRRRPEREAMVGGDGLRRDPAAATDARLDVTSALRRLPAQQRAAVVLHYLDDLPVVDVADALGCSPSTARVHLHRARATLAGLLGEELDDDLR